MRSKKIVLGLVLFGLVLGLSTNKSAAQGIEVDVSADLVSSYVWRGFKGAGASVQPSLSTSVDRFTLGAWGSTDFYGGGAKEADFYASYSLGGVEITVTDYWWDNDGTFRYFSHPNGGDGHLLEGSLTYTLSESLPISLSWNTFIMGKGNKKADGKNSFSTYVEASYPFSIGGVDMQIATGFTPWESVVYGTDGLKFTNILIRASKEVKITDSFTLPVFTQLIANPAVEDINFVFGVTIK